MHALKLRHRAELQELKKSAKTGKGAAKELRLKEKEMKERHEAELEALRNQKSAADTPAEDVADSPAGQEEKEGDDEVKMEAEQKPRKSKAQRRRERREAREKQEIEEAERRRAALPDRRAEENAQLEGQLEALGLSIVQIQSDGHCLYNAIGDQLAHRGMGNYSPEGGKSLMPSLRQSVSQHMLDKEDDFVHFFEEEDGMSAGDRFREYCESIRSVDKAVWGGEHELVTLANVLRRKIVVHQANAAPITYEPIGGDAPELPSLQISYHKHQYSLGNHYNSLQDIQKMEA